MNGRQLFIHLRTESNSQLPAHLQLFGGEEIDAVTVYLI